MSIQMLVVRFQFVGTVLPDDKGVIYMSHPKSGFVCSKVKDIKVSTGGANGVTKTAVLLVAVW